MKRERWGLVAWCRDLNYSVNGAAFGIVKYTEQQTVQNVEADTFLLVEIWHSIFSHFGVDIGGPVKTCPPKALAVLNIVVETQCEVMGTNKASHQGLTIERYNII